MKHLRKFTCLFLLLTLSTFCFANQELTWYPFDRDFINAKYSSSAIGELSFRVSHPAGTVHSSSCGGNDAELHIGMTLPEINLPSGQMPLSDSPGGDDDDWGVVAELPNTKSGNGKSQLAKLAGQPVKFFGYFRVWDEGHAKGHVFPSNPHHVFEVHPAWGFSGTAVNRTAVSFSRKDLVRPMDSYQGYGATKFKPLFKSLANEQWPKAFRSGGRLHLGLLKFSNFFQLPAKIKSITSVSGGHEVKVDVFSDSAMTNKVYTDLTTITVTGTSIDGALSVGQKAFLLGFFSVNLKKALDASEGATSNASAVAVPEAVEFFVFGRAINPAVTSCGS
jgi:hypothetical protein